MDENEGDTIVVILRTSCTPHHLQYISDREVHITFRFTIVIFGPLYDDKMGGKVDAPSKGGSSDQYLEDIFETGKGKLIQRT